MAEVELQYSPMLGRRTRTGPWDEQIRSTYRLIQEAIDAGEWDRAAALANYFVDEAEVCFAIYRQWIPDLRAHLRANGVSAEEVAALDTEIVDKLNLPDGSYFDRYRMWHEVKQRIEDLVGAIHRHEADKAKVLLDDAKETWRRTHDRDVDHSYGLMDAIVRRFGESEIGPMWERVLLPLFAWRYDKFDISKHEWPQALDSLMLVAIEAMRGHLVGPERTGDMELEEHEDRFVLRFDPCGSGQRTVRGDWIENTPPRMEPPYNWKVSEEPHPWNHFQTGVCHYCTHCIALMEELPIDRFGYPLRVINPPRYPDTDRDPTVRQKCQWTMYKDPRAVPEADYELSGRKKTGKFGSTEVGAPPLPEVVSGMPGAG
jgi:hypothetical protein